MMDLFLTNMTAASAFPVAYQCPLRPALPCVYGPLDYRTQRDFYERIDGLLRSTGLEDAYVAGAFAHSGRDWSKASARSIERFGRYASLALRVNIVRSLTGLSLRALSVRAADSGLLAWFLGTAEIDRVKSPSKSTVQRFGLMVAEPLLRELNDRLIAAGAAPVEISAEGVVTQPAGLETPVESADLFADVTCLEAPIHFPVDWVLLRDAVRTLTKAVALIRRGGLRERMPQEPCAFLTNMNRLCLQMAAQRRQVQSRKNRKAILRAMKRLTAVVRRHAQSHRALLEKGYGEAGFSAAQAAQILRRIDSVLQQLPAAVKQAHERLIGGRAVPNEEKILSLYEPGVKIIVRGKADAEVEFGSKLWLGELRCGLIADYELHAENTADAQCLPPALQRLQSKPALKIKTMWGDRGVHSAANERLLAEAGIASGLCPRDPAVLAARLQKEPALRAGLKRRGGTEARIAIFKNVFCQGRLRDKGPEHRAVAVGRAVLAHNLFVLARLQAAQEKAAEEAAARARERKERREAA